VAVEIALLPENVARLTFPEEAQSSQPRMFPAEWTWSYEEGVLTLQGEFETWRGPLEADGTWRAESLGYTAGRTLDVRMTDSSSLRTAPTTRE